MIQLLTGNHLFIITFGTGTISIFAGIMLLKFPPKKINRFYGYRTSSSMKNQNRWNFAQIYSSKEIIKIGLFNIIISIISLFFHLKETMSMILGLSIMFLSIFVLLFRVEKAIKIKFKDEKNAPQHRV